MQQPIDHYLSHEEKIVYRAYRHWILFLPCLLWMVVATMFLTTFAVYKNFASVALIMVLFYGVNRSIDFFLSDIIVTNNRILLRMGLIRHLWVEALLDNIASFECKQTLMGRLFNYGTLYVYDAGHKGFPIVNISAPIELRRQIQVEMDRFKKVNMMTIQNIRHPSRT